MRAAARPAPLPPPCVVSPIGSRRCGLSGLRAACEQVFRVYTAGTGPLTAVLLHGGGHTSLTWALTADKLKESLSVIAIDLRGHGA